MRHELTLHQHLLLTKRMLLECHRLILLLKLDWVEQRLPVRVRNSIAVLEGVFHIFYVRLNIVLGRAIIRDVSRTQQLSPEESVSSTPRSMWLGSNIWALIGSYAGSTFGRLRVMCNVASRTLRMMVHVESDLI